MSDVREALIEDYRQLLLTLAPSEQREVWARMSQLIKGRSPQQVERMERERGLRAS